ncbi:hypothetical protein BT96DRAFT_1007984 [Gymnopus androsaceus JB14]|uniref:Uncharacterized protein n=1 Tax=Gymnopus androsaceus JB14 TaxID=1447944 RepID=A0A6A4GGB6_9AGAR|nr:hypothetical protein BT96DRAFT_1007984 [Gymnopus androsaceus JB14]
MADFQAHSPLWLCFWSADHGLVYSTQPELTLQVLASFHSEVVRKNIFDNTPVWQVMKEHQDVYNGFGAQEATDVLFDALIHSRMPISLICRNDTMWTRFSTAVAAHQEMQVYRVMDPDHLGAKALPYISNTMFKMNTSGHQLYCADILCYQKEQVYLCQEKVEMANSMGVFNPAAILDETGVAKVPLATLPSRASL